MTTEKEWNLSQNESDMIDKIRERGWVVVLISPLDLQDSDRAGIEKELEQHGFDLISGENDDG